MPRFIAILPGDFRPHTLHHAIRAGLRQFPSAALAAGIASVLAGPSAEAATFTVTNTNDSGAGSLRQAALDANAAPGADDILFASGVTGTIALSSGQIDLKSSLNVGGPGAETLTISGGGGDAIFHVYAEATEPEIAVTLARLRLTGADTAIRAEDSEASGHEGIALTVRDSVISGNTHGLSVVGGRTDSYACYDMPGVSFSISIIRSKVSLNRGTGISVSRQSEVNPFYCDDPSELALTVRNTLISGNGGDGIAASRKVFRYALLAHRFANVAVISTSITGNGGAGLKATEAKVVQSRISGNGGVGVAAYTAVVQEGRISGNREGLKGQQFTIEASEIVDNEGVGVAVSGIPQTCTRCEAIHGKLSVVRSTVSGNGGPGLTANDSGSATLDLRDSTVASNNGVGVALKSGRGGLSIERSTVSGNAGAGIDFAATWNDVVFENPEGYVALAIRNATISGNTGGCGIQVESSFQGNPPQAIAGATIVGNSAGGICHAMDAYSAANGLNLQLQNTIIAGNAVSGIPDLSGPFISDWNLIGNAGTATLTESVPGSNLISQNALLGPLQNNGGRTATHAPLPGSPALDRGDPRFTPPPEFDQRGSGFARVFGGRVDIGALEAQPLGLQNVNSRVSLVPQQDTFFRSSETTGCPTGYVGTFGFDAALTNTSRQVLSALQVEVATLTQQNLLLADNALLGPGGAFLVEQRGDYADGLLGPTEKVDVPFKVCLKTWEKFQFFTDVLGHLDTAKARKKLRRAAR